MPLRFRLEDLSPAQQEQVRRQLSPHSTPSSAVRAKNLRNHDKNTSAKQKETVDVGHFQDKTTNLALSDVDVSNSSFSVPRTQNLREDKMSGTEKAYLRDVLHGNGLFEAITLKSPSGNRYTPDFVTMIDGVPSLVEVKGNYRLDSEGRAHTAFMEAASNFSSIFKFIWVRREKCGKWTTKIVIPCADTKSTNQPHHITT